MVKTVPHFGACVAFSWSCVNIYFIFIKYTAPLHQLNCYLQYAWNASDVDYCRSLYFRSMKISRIGAHVHIRDTKFSRMCRHLYEKKITKYAKQAAVFW